MSARWDQEPMTMNLKPIRDMRWDVDPAEMARRLDMNTRVIDSLQVQLRDAERKAADVAVALVAARRKRVPDTALGCLMESYRMLCHAGRKALRSRRFRLGMYGAYGAGACLLLGYGCIALAGLAASWGWVR